ncbi:MAG: hypothetical protein NTZ01_06345, partial [Verrucomicrobia bacterium]|nr:hypothetical protein [Verrucomicrobiota bacterium]
MPPTAPLKPGKPAKAGDQAETSSQKKKLVALAAIITSTPFFIAVAVHILALVTVGGVVVFKGGNPLAIFTSENVDSGDPGAESAAPPSPDDNTPEEPSTAMSDANPTPTETDNSTDILALSTPSSVPSFAPSAPAKLSASNPGQGSGGTGTGSRGSGGSGKGRRTAKSTLFGFSEKMGGELEGTMYDLKLKADGKKPSGIDEKSFPEAVRKIIRNRFRASSLSEFYRVDKKFFATQFFIPLQEAGKAPETFGVKGKVKPNNFIIHYTGS